MWQILTIAIFYMVLSILARLPISNLYIDLLSHWPHIALICGLGLGIFLLALKNYRKNLFLWGFILVGMGANIYGIVAIPEPRGFSEPQDNRLRIAYANLSVGNIDTEGFTSWIARESPDIIAVVELSPIWDAAIQTSLSDYEPMAIYPSTGSYGIGIYANKGIINTELLPVDMPDNVPMIRAELDFETGDTRTLFLTHTILPASNAYIKARSQNYMQIHEAIAAETEPVIVIGDMNASPTSYAFQHELISESLHPVAYLNTWSFIFPNFLGISIDHVLTEDGIGVSRLESGVDFGSDHLPLIIEISPNNLDE